MNPLIEKLNQDIAAFHNNPKNARDFFLMLWPVSINAPRVEVTAIYQKNYDWALRHKTENPEIFALATFSQGYIYFHSEMYDESLKNMGEAEKLFSELNDEDGIAICLAGYGGIFRALGNIDLALKYFTEAFHQLVKSHAYPFFETICSYGLASMYLEIKTFEKAIEAFKTCFDISVKYNDKNFELLCLGSLGDANANLGRDETALSYFNKALELGKIIGNKNFYSRVLSDLAAFYFSRNQLEKALELNWEALAIRDELNMHGGAITNLLLLARIQQKQNHIESAIETLQKAMSLAEKLNVRPKIFQIHLLLSEMYELKNELRISFEHFKKYQQISEEVYKEDGEKKLQRSEMIFEAEQTKKENIIIKNQKLQIEKTNIELQKTIDELSLSKINRKAKTITLTIAILLFIIEDSIIHYVIAPYTHDNFLISLTANFSVVFLIKPIERMVEHYLLRRLFLEKKEYTVVSK